MRALRGPTAAAAARRLAGALLVSLLALVATGAHAGAQKEEDLADSVRGALAAAIADDRPLRPVFASGGERLAYLKWLGEMSARQLKETTMDPATRKLEQVEIDPATGALAGDLVERLMGRRPELRLAFIQENVRLACELDV